MMTNSAADKSKKMKIEACWDGRVSWASSLPNLRDRASVSRPGVADDTFVEYDNDLSWLGVVPRSWLYP